MVEENEWFSSKPMTSVGSPASAPVVIRGPVTGSMINLLLNGLRNSFHLEYFHHLPPLS